MAKIKTEQETKTKTKDISDAIKILETNTTALKDVKKALNNLPSSLEVGYKALLSGLTNTIKATSINRDVNNPTSVNKAQARDEEIKDVRTRLQLLATLRSVSTYFKKAQEDEKQTSIINGIKQAPGGVGSSVLTSLLTGGLINPVVAHITKLDKVTGFLSQKLLSGTKTLFDNTIAGISGKETPAQKQKALNERSKLELNEVTKILLKRQDTDIPFLKEILKKIHTTLSSMHQNNKHNEIKSDATDKVLPEVHQDSLQNDSSTVKSDSSIFSTLVTIFGTVSLFFKDKITSFFAPSGFLGGILNSTFNFIKTNASKIFNLIKPFTTTIFNFIKSGITNVFGIIKNGIPKIFQLFKTGVPKMLGLMKNALGGAGKFIATKVGTAAKSVGAILTKIGPSLGPILKASAAAKTIVDTALVVKDFYQKGITNTYHDYKENFGENKLDYINVAKMGVIAGGTAGEKIGDLIVDKPESLENDKRQLEVFKELAKRNSERKGTAYIDELQLLVNADRDRKIRQLKTQQVPTQEEILAMSAKESQRQQVNDTTEAITKVVNTNTVAPQTNVVNNIQTPQSPSVYQTGDSARTMLFGQGY